MLDDELLDRSACAKLVTPFSSGATLAILAGARRRASRWYNVTVKHGRTAEAANVAVGLEVGRLEVLDDGGLVAADEEAQQKFEQEPEESVHISISFQAGDTASVDRFAAARPASF